MAKTSPPKSDTPVSIRLYPEQKKKLKTVSRQIRLSEQDCLRKALDFGLPILRDTILSLQNAKPREVAA